MEETVKQRLIQFMKHKGMGQSKFEKTVGLSNGYINQLRNSPSIQKIEMIIGTFPELNRAWLLTGEGEMLKDTVADLKNGNPNVPHISYTTGVPYYNVDFIGGFDIVENDQTLNPEYLIDFRQYNEATCWCNVTGHSMEPEIAHGDIIALKKIEDFSFIPLGEVYAIVTTNGMRTIKRIGPSQNKDMYTLIPTNKSPEYGEQELPKTMIMYLYQVLGCMKRL